MLCKHGIICNHTLRYNCFLLRGKCYLAGILDAAQQSGAAALCSKAPLTSPEQKSEAVLGGPALSLGYFREVCVRTVLFVFISLCDYAPDLCVLRGVNSYNSALVFSEQPGEDWLKGALCTVNSWRDWAAIRGLDIGAMLKQAHVCCKQPWCRALEGGVDWGPGRSQDLVVLMQHAMAFPNLGTEEAVAYFPPKSEILVYIFHGWMQVLVSFTLLLEAWGLSDQTKWEHLFLMQSRGLCKHPCVGMGPSFAWKLHFFLLLGRMNAVLQPLVTYLHQWILGTETR